MKILAFIVLGWGFILSLMYFFAFLGANEYNKIGFFLSQPFPIFCFFLGVFVFLFEKTSFFWIGFISFGYVICVLSLLSIPILYKLLGIN